MKGLEVDVVKVTSKGQLVVPQHMRKELNLHAGDRMIVIRQKSSLMMKPLSALASDVESELFDMSRATRAWEEIEAGKSRKMSKEQFLEELAKW